MKRVSPQTAGKTAMACTIATAEDKDASAEKTRTWPTELRSRKASFDPHQEAAEIQRHDDAGRDPVERFELRPDSDDRTAEAVADHEQRHPEQKCRGG